MEVVVARHTHTLDPQRQRSGRHRNLEHPEKEWSAGHVKESRGSSNDGVFYVAHHRNVPLIDSSAMKVIHLVKNQDYKLGVNQTPKSRRRLKPRRVNKFIPAQ